MIRWKQLSGSSASLLDEDWERGRSKMLVYIDSSDILQFYLTIMSNEKRDTGMTWDESNGCYEVRN